MALPPATLPSPNWQLAFAIAAAGHLGLGMAIALDRSEPSAQVPDPVMVVELGAGIAPAPAEPAVTPPEQSPPQQQVQTPVPQMTIPRIDVPEVAAPLPPDPVTIAPLQPVARAAPPVRSDPPVRAAAPLAAASPVADNSGSGAGDNSRAQAARDDWYALIFADLARKKRYPREARRAGQEGTPTVRFTVDSRGRVSNISITRSSGYRLLDDATIELIRRAAPLPRMPRAMGRESVTMSLPIEYKLDRD